MSTRIVTLKSLESVPPGRRVDIKWFGVALSRITGPIEVMYLRKVQSTKKVVFRWLANQKQNILLTRKYMHFFHFLLIIHLIFNWKTHLKVFGSTAGFWGCGKAPVTGEKQLWSRIGRKKKRKKEKNCKNQAIGKSSTTHTIKNLLALCFNDRARVNVSTAFAPRPFWWFLMAGRIWRQNKHNTSASRDI